MSREWPKGRFWDEYTDEQRVQLVEETFRYYRETGYPFFSLSTEEKESEFQSIVKSGSAVPPILEGDIIRQVMQGLGLAWMYFPHHIGVRCGKMLTPLDAFNSDDMLRQVILKRLRYGGYLSDSGIRKNLKVLSGVQSVSNFRPTAAKAIYDHFGGGVVWDMSCGFGGRLLGAMASNSVTKYFGTEPEGKTFQGLHEMKGDLAHLHKVEIDLVKSGSECFIPNSPVDICFTSPPYFDHEKYGEGHEQSYVSYPTPSDWMYGFMGSTIDNCVACLKDDGHLIINVANVPTYPTLLDDFMKLVEAKKLRLVRTLQLALSKMPTLGKAKSGFKYEPMFVFRKA